MGGLRIWPSFGRRGLGLRCPFLIWICRGIVHPLGCALVALTGKRVATERAVLFKGQDGLTGAEPLPVAVHHFCHLLMARFGRWAGGRMDVSVFRHEDANDMAGEITEVLLRGSLVISAWPVKVVTVCCRPRGIVHDKLHPIGGHVLSRQLEGVASSPVSTHQGGLVGRYRGGIPVKTLSLSFSSRTHSRP